jgi:type IV secretion system protein VirB10
MAPQPDPYEIDEIEPTPLWRRGRVQLAAVVALVVLGFLFTRGKAPPKPDETKATDNYIGVVVPYQATKAEAAPPAPVKAATPVPVSEPVVAAAPPAPTMPPLPRLSGPRAPEPFRPVMLSFAVPHTDGPKPGTAPAEAPETGVDFKTARLPGTKASPAIDDTYLLMPGLLPLVLDTAIESDLPGPILAHTPGPVYSRNGVLLLEAGTQVIGRYESIGKTGSNRLLAKSVYAVTPHGIFVPLSGESLADDLGRTGLDGAIDNHFAQRFGVAILLSLGESAMGVLQADVSKGGNTYLDFNSGGGVGGLAQQILQAQVNIPPTFSKHQGETIALFIDQPVDFSASYRIRTVGNHP